MITISREQKILITDDSEINRSILADILENEYEIIEAENGVQAVAALQKYNVELALVLLDIVMPEMDGFGVLEAMNEHHWIEDIPVIMISAETKSSYVERAYGLGVCDFINRPFDALVVHRRVMNTILLYAKQKKLIGLLGEQLIEKERNNNMMIDILSHIVEFRNGESGQHVRHVHVLTDMLLRRLIQKTDQYGISSSEISLISTASALHDIGKIAIDEKVLNKPGRLTDEEFAIMKTHSRIGADMLEGIPIYQNEQLVTYAYEICRWHHERYDGRGYPDGLKGDEIPISAQVVAMADVYDALTSERVYKKAFTHEKAVQMILNGECGTFNPQILECLMDISGRIQKELNSEAPAQMDQRDMNNMVQEMMHHEELTASERTLLLLEREREKYTFFAAMSQEIQFEYNVSPPMTIMAPWGAERLGIEETIMDPYNDPRVTRLSSQKDWKEMARMLRETTPEDPIIRYDCKICCKGEFRWHRIVARAMWSPDDVPEYQGAIGEATDIQDSRQMLDTLRRKASHDALSGLLNHASAKELIIQRMAEQPEGQYALVIFDLDHFKQANDTYGHKFGDEVIKFTAAKLEQCTRNMDIAARVGGDEFLIFLDYQNDVEPIISRIFYSLTGSYEDFSISLSMGVAKSEMVGMDYDKLFRSADQALYAVKRSGRGQYRYYDESMHEMFSAISTIDSDQDEQAEQDGGNSQDE